MNGSVGSGSMTSPRPRACRAVRIPIGPYPCRVGDASEWPSAVSAGIRIDTRGSIPLPAPAPARRPRGRGPHRRGGTLGARRAADPPSGSGCRAARPALPTAATACFVSWWSIAEQLGHRGVQVQPAHPVARPARPRSAAARQPARDGRPRWSAAAVPRAVAARRPGRSSAPTPASATACASNAGSTASSMPVDRRVHDLHRPPRHPAGRNRAQTNGRSRSQPLRGVHEGLRRRCRDPELRTEIEEEPLLVRRVRRPRPTLVLGARACQARRAAPTRCGLPVLQQPLLRLDLLERGEHRIRLGARVRRRRDPRAQLGGESASP